MIVGGYHFSEVWFADFEFHAPTGHRSEPICLVAHEIGSGQTVRFSKRTYGNSIAHHMQRALILCLLPISLALNFPATSPLAGRSPKMCLIYMLSFAITRMDCPRRRGIVYSARWSITASLPWEQPKKKLCGN